MVEIKDTPLPEDFYNEEGWVKSLVDHYGPKHKNLLPEEALLYPMQVLARATRDVSFIYGLFPEIVYKSLKQTIDPLFEPKEYIEKIYDVLYDAGIEEDRPGLVTYAQQLLVLRKIFERDKAFYKKHFAKEIKKTPGKGANSKFEKFTSDMQQITKTHVNQIRRVIANR